MPKISIELGVTIPGQKEYNTLRAAIKFDEIETNGDIKAQVEECIAAIEQAAESAEGSLAQQISNLSGLSIEGVGLATEFSEFKEKVRVWAQEIIDKMKKLEEPKRKKKE